jgi:hypothetical protein
VEIYQYLNNNDLFGYPEEINSQYYTRSKCWRTYKGHGENMVEFQLHFNGFLRGDHAFLYPHSSEDKKTGLYIGYGSFYKNGGLEWDDVCSAL